MAKVPKPVIRWVGAHPNNFTVGRPGGSIGRRETFHHIVGSGYAAEMTFNNPGRQASAHFSVDYDGEIRQHVDVNNTAYSDGNWASNIMTISVEHAGGGGGIDYTAKMYEAAAHLRAWLIQTYGPLVQIRHREISSTACPGGLNVEAIVNRANAIIAEWNRPPAAIQPEWLKKRKAVDQYTVYAQSAGIFIRNLNKPSDPADSRRFALNQSFAIGGYTEVDGKKYLISVSSMGDNAPNGILESEVARSPYVPPSPWVDLENRRFMRTKERLYVINIDNKQNQGNPIEAGVDIEIWTKKTVDGVTYLRSRYATQEGFNWGIPADKLMEVPVPAPDPVPEPQPEPEPPVVTPPAPTTPAWADSVIDDVNQEMYVLRATPIIDLEDGRPLKDENGKDRWLQAGDIVEDISAHTIIDEVTYQITEYSFKQIEGGQYQNANGIKASDLTIDPKACPEGTPANPAEPQLPETPIADDTKQDDDVIYQITSIREFFIALGVLIAELVAKLKKEK